MAPLKRNNRFHAISERLNTLEEALSEAEARLSKDPADQELRAETGRILIDIGEAREDLADFFYANPEKCQGRYDEAERAYKAALEVLKTADDRALPLKAKTLYHLYQYPEAIIYYEKILEKDPSNKDAWLHKGYMLLKDGQYDEAEKCFNEAAAAQTAQTNPHIKAENTCTGLTPEAGALFRKDIDALYRRIETEFIHLPEEDKAKAGEDQIAVEIKFSIDAAKKEATLDRLFKYAPIPIHLSDELFAILASHFKDYTLVTPALEGYQLASEIQKHFPDAELTQMQVRGPQGEQILRPKVRNTP